MAVSNILPVTESSKDYLLKLCFYFIYIMMVDVNDAKYKSVISMDI